MLTKLRYAMNQLREALPDRDLGPMTPAAVADRIRRALDALESVEAEMDTAVPEPEDDRMTDAEADADALKSAGMGTDEDYGGYEDRGDFWDD